MQPLPCTTIAGRAAADRRRAAASDERLQLQQRARLDLDQVLRAHGLTTVPHLDPKPGIEHSLWVACRLATASGDHQLVYAILDARGWMPDSTRLSRFRESHDVVRVRHGDSGAQLVLIIKTPFGRIEYVEAA